MNELYNIRSVKNNKCEFVKYSFSEIIDYFYNNCIEIKFEDILWLRFSKDYIEPIYMPLNEEVMLFRIDKEGNKDLTECGKYISSSINNILDDIYNTTYSVCCLLMSIINTKKYKIIKGRWYDKINYNKGEVIIRHYPKVNDYFSYEIKSNKVSIVNNDICKIEKVVPSKYYPLPNNGAIKVFTSENTSEIESSIISDILSKEKFDIGFCYTNSEKIVNILNADQRFTGKVEFYTGWLLFKTHMTHHAWVVIDELYVLDVGKFKKEEELCDILLDKMKNGLRIDSNIATPNIFKKWRDEELPFRTKYNYGKVAKGCLYVGVKSNAMEARISYNNLIAKYPNHPDYLNVDKETGLNDTLRTIYS